MAQCEYRDRAVAGTMVAMSRFIAVAALLLAACAQPGLPDELSPDGGERDLHRLPIPDAASAMVDAARDLAAPGPCDLPNSDGTECAATSDPCLEPGRCQAGACGPITMAPDGTVCAAAAGPCDTAATCKAGVCGAPGKHPDGYNYDQNDHLARCCGGAPTKVDSNGNCGACGVACENGNTCIARNTGKQGETTEYYCTCNANAECWSKCCSTFYGPPYVCAASDCTGACIACPGGATCTGGLSSQPNYCHY
jgi:hypothetical protein